MKSRRLTVLLRNSDKSDTVSLIIVKVQSLRIRQVRCHNLPAPATFDVGISVALLRGHRLPVALVFGDDAADQDHSVAVRAGLHLLGMEFLRRSALWPGPLQRRNNLSLRLHRAVRKSNRKVVGD